MKIYYSDTRKILTGGAERFYLILTIKKYTHNNAYVFNSGSQVFKFLNYPLVAALQEMSQFFTG